MSSRERICVLAQLSEPHITAGPRGDEAAAALARAVGAVMALQTPPDAVVVTGDLADTGTPAEYARFAELVAPLPMPVHVLAGNHDRPAAMPAGVRPPAASYSVAVGALRLTVLDSTLPGQAGGRLGPERLAWLEAELALAPDTPTVIAMHHPPMPIGVPAMDAIGVPAADRDALGAVLRRHPQVQRVIAGHAHRAAGAVLGGCGVFVCPGVHLQLELDLTAGRLATVREPPGYALHVLTGATLVSHVVPIGDFATCWTG